MRHNITTTTRNVATSIAAKIEGGNVNLAPSQKLTDTITDRLDEIASSVGIDRNDVLPTKAADLVFLYEANAKNGVYDNEPEPITL